MDSLRVATLTYMRKKTTLSAIQRVYLCEGVSPALRGVFVGVCIAVMVWGEGKRRCSGKGC